MNQHELTSRVVTPDELDWPLAVQCKRKRAYRQLMENDALTLQEIETQYEAFHQAQGIALHDKVLREEIANGQLITWWRGEEFVGYASVLKNNLLGNSAHPILDVVDVCLEPLATESECRQIVCDLLEQGRVQNAAHVQIQCDDVLAEHNASLGGLAVKHTFQYNLTR